MTLMDLLRPSRPKTESDPDLDRLLAAAEAGRAGVNLAAMSDEEMIKILARPPR